MVISIMGIIVKRKEAKTLNQAKRWFFVFGRRKTGKSFMVKEFVNWNSYYFVKRDKAILSEKNGLISYDTFIIVLKKELIDGKTVVVDEFHRLGDSFFDELHAMRKKGKLIVISSTLFLAKKLLSERSPLLGLFAEIPVQILDLTDLLRTLPTQSKKGLVETAIIAREPMVLPTLTTSHTSHQIFSTVLRQHLLTIPAFVGEIFLEEERTPSMVYEGILRAIASGKTGTGELAGVLYARKLIPRQDPSIVHPYLNNLLAFGLVKKIPVFNKKKFKYKLRSPLMSAFYYADEKYNITERDVTYKEIERMKEEIIPRLVEDNVREFLAKKYGLIEAVIEENDYDIDACLIRFKKPEIVVEIKWKNNIKEEEFEKARRNLSKIDAKKRWIFVPDKKKYKGEDIRDIGDFI